MRVLNEKLCADILETGRKEFLAFRLPGCFIAAYKPLHWE